MKRVWTFVIEGGEPFSLTVPGGPSCNHRGGRTVWKLVGGAGLSKTVAQMMRALGAQVETYTEAESPEQAAERRKLLGLP